MPAPFVHLSKELEDVAIPAKGILSKTLFADEHVKVVLFGFDAGQDLSEHTAAMPATLQFIRGEAELTLGDERVSAGPGSWVYMAPNLRHAVVAKTPVVMLLTLMRGGLTLPGRG